MPLSSFLSLSHSHQQLHVRGPGALALDKREDALLRFRHRGWGKEGKVEQGREEREEEKEEQKQVDDDGPSALVVKKKRMEATQKERKNQVFIYFSLSKLPPQR